MTHAPSLADLWSLVKPRIVGLLCLTGVSAALAAGGAALPTLAAFVAAGALVAAGSAACNCIYDRDLDRHMARTADRPLPRGDLGVGSAVAFALVLFAAGTAIGLAALPLEAVGYMWLGVAAYVGLYTVGLKRRHWLGVVLGGSAGSFPVLAGWAAVGDVGLAAVLMAALVFAWTPAHAWALAHVYRDDFAAAGVPTLPVVADAATVRRAVWTSAVAGVVVAALVVPLAGPVYTAVLVTGAPLFLLAYRAYRVDGSEPAAVRAFFTSNAFLALVFLGWAADGVLPAGARVPVALLAATVVPLVFLGMWSAQPALRGVPGAVGGEWRALVHRSRHLVRALVVRTSP